ncbi:unnamed protein product [Rhizophagus irregularis]|uniref:Uncharacterized protein n=1 Tax=Rhizophagus irregularis TaxID=588596 RepID=A0A915YR09_9GLOM|nr:unnamed protein product [Rhizophagus irregularis]CAB5361749.1 unnamed protein product [Rhizophagus irregularis]
MIRGLRLEQKPKCSLVSDIYMIKTFDFERVAAVLLQWSQSLMRGQWIVSKLKFENKISRAGLIDISRDRTSVAGKNPLLNILGYRYNEAIALANYLEINNYTSNSIQQQISYNETSSDNNTNAPEIIDNEDDQL